MVFFLFFLCKCSSLTLRITCENLAPLHPPFSSLMLTIPALQCEPRNNPTASHIIVRRHTYIQRDLGPASWHPCQPAPFGIISFRRTTIVVSGTGGLSQAGPLGDGFVRFAGRAVESMVRQNQGGMLFERTKQWTASSHASMDPIHASQSAIRPTSLQPYSCESWCSCLPRQ